jgi:hypothetical protein
VQTPRNRRLLEVVAALSAALAFWPAAGWAQDSSPGDEPAASGHAGPRPPTYGPSIVWRDPIDDDDDDEYDGPPGPGRMYTGAALTVTGVTGGVVGVVMAGAGASNARSDALPVGIGVSVVGGLMVSVGIPLWVTGSARYQEEPYLAYEALSDERKKELRRRARPKEPRPSKGIRNAGIALTFGGTGVGAVGLAFLAYPVDFRVVSAVCGAAGGAMFLAGIPLWVAGQERADGAPSASSAEVKLTIGAASAAVQGRF